MNCRLSNEFLMKHFDRNINDIESAQLKQHLRICSSCSSCFNELSYIVDNLEKPEIIIEPPEDFEFRVLERVKILKQKQQNDRMISILFGVSTIIFVVFLLCFVQISRNTEASAILHKIITLKGLLGYFREVPAILQDFTYSVFHSIRMNLPVIAADFFNGIIFIFIVFSAFLVVFSPNRKKA